MGGETPNRGFDTTRIANEKAIRAEKERQKTMKEVIGRLNELMDDVGALGQRVMAAENMAARMQDYLFQLAPMDEMRRYAKILKIPMHKTWSREALIQSIRKVELEKGLGLESFFNGSESEEKVSEGISEITEEISGDTLTDGPKDESEIEPVGIGSEHSDIPDVE